MSSNDATRTGRSCSSVRDGFFVRSPLAANGITVSEKDRRRYEDDFLARVKKRESREGRRGREDGVLRL
jgi:hypothetical protein